MTDPSPPSPDAMTHREAVQRTAGLAQSAPYTTPEEREALGVLRNHQCPPPDDDQTSPTALRIAAREAHEVRLLVDLPARATHRQLCHRLSALTADAGREELAEQVRQVARTLRSHSYGTTSFQVGLRTGHLGAADGLAEAVGIKPASDELLNCPHCEAGFRFDAEQRVPVHDGEHGRCDMSGRYRCPTCRAVPRAWADPCPTCRHDGAVALATPAQTATPADNATVTVGQLTVSASDEGVTIRGLPHQPVTVLTPEVAHAVVRVSGASTPGDSRRELGATYPGEDALVERVTSELWPDLGDRLTAARAVRIVLQEQARACEVGPRPSEGFPAVDPARDLPAAVVLIRRVAAERHPYDAVLLGMAADVLQATPGDERRRELAVSVDQRNVWANDLRAVSTVVRESTGAVAKRCDRIADELDALAAPAETSVQGSPTNPESESPAFRDTGIAAPAETEARDDVAREVIVALRGLHSLLFVIAENLRGHATDARVSIAQAGNLDGCRRDVTRMIERLGATPPAPEGEAGSEDLIDRATRAALDGIHHPDDRTVEVVVEVLAQAGWLRTPACPPAPGEDHGATEGGGWTLTGDALYGAASERARTVLPAATVTPLADLFANLAYYRAELAGSWHEAGEALARAILRSSAPAGPQAEGAAGGER